MTEIETYISQQPSVAQPHLHAMYQLLKQTLPQAQERISYGMPAFWQGQVLVYFGANANFLGFYPTAAPIAEFASRLEGYHTSKGAVQFPYAKPLPLDLISAMVAWRAVHVEQHTPPKRRPKAVMPDGIAQILATEKLREAFDARPAYQQTDYLNWIAQAKRPETQSKRRDQMLAELRAGDVYMKQPWHSRH